MLESNAARVGRDSVCARSHRDQHQTGTRTGPLRGRSIIQPIFLSCPRGKCRKRRLDAGLARMALTLARYACPYVMTC